MIGIGRGRLSRLSGLRLPALSRPAEGPHVASTPNPARRRRPGTASRPAPSDLPTLAQAVSPDVVISQVYGGGGNTGATLTNDFIELYNRGASTVAIDGWSVQYASATGTTWTNITPLSGVIPPGEHYLIQEAQGTGGTTALPAPDATGTIAMGATAGKVALVTATGALTCGSNCDTAAAVRDFVGYGNGERLRGDSADARASAIRPPRFALRMEPPTPTKTPPTSPPVLRIPETAGRTAFRRRLPQAATSPPHIRSPRFRAAGPARRSPGSASASKASSPATSRQAGGLGGFFVQDDTPDADPATSDGLFAFSALPPSVATASCVERHRERVVRPDPAVPGHRRRRLRHRDDRAADVRPAAPGGRHVRARRGHARDLPRGPDRHRALPARPLRRGHRVVRRAPVPADRSRRPRCPGAGAARPKRAPAAPDRRRLERPEPGDRPVPRRRRRVRIGDTASGHHRRARASASASTACSRPTPITLRPDEPATRRARRRRRRRQGRELQHAELLHDARRRQPERARREQRRGVRPPAGQGGRGDPRHRRRRRRPDGGREQRHRRRSAASSTRSTPRPRRAPTPTSPSRRSTRRTSSAGPSAPTRSRSR